MLAGKEYGTGSSRDWAAKGTVLLGVRAVIAESFERIHRSNLIGMGVLPLQFADGESVRIARTRRPRGVHDPRTRRRRAAVGGQRGGRRRVGLARSFTCRVRIDTPKEADYYRHGGILQYVVRQLSRT